MITGESSAIRIALAVARKPVRIAPTVNEDPKISGPGGNDAPNRNQRRPAAKATTYG